MLSCYFATSISFIASIWYQGFATAVIKLAHFSLLCVKINKRNMSSMDRGLKIFDMNIFMMTSSNEKNSALLTLCAGISPVTGEFPSQRPVTRSFDVFFDLRLNKRLSKQSWGWWFGTPSPLSWRHCNVAFQPEHHVREFLLYTDIPAPSWWLEMSWLQIESLLSVIIMFD